MQIVNEKQLHTQVANLKELRVKFDKAGRPTMVAFASRNPAVSMTPLKGRIKQALVKQSGREANFANQLHITLSESEGSSAKVTDTALK